MNKTIHIFLILFLSSLTFKAQTWTQSGSTIIGGDAGQSCIGIGSSVSMSSDGSIISYGYVTYANSIYTGHIKVYLNFSSNWLQLGEDIIIDNTSGYFGRIISLSSDGTTVAVGIPYGNNNFGQTKVYRFINNDWVQIGNDIIGEEDDKLGYSVSLNNDGSILAVSSPFNTPKVKIFQFQNNDWEQIGDNIYGDINNSFGAFISLNATGNIVAVSASLGGTNNSGIVKVFQNNNEVWTQIGQDIEGEAELDYSGFPAIISSDGTTVAIGSYYNNGNGENSGHVRVYRFNNNTWTQIGQDIDGEAEEEHWSNVNISSDGDIIVVSSNVNSGNGEYSGGIKIFQNNNGNWEQIGETIYGEAAGDFFGTSIDISSDGQTVVASSKQNSGAHGYFKLYKLTNSNIKSLNLNGISIYPNPANDILNFNLGQNKIKKIKITSITGKTVKQISHINNNLQVDISNFKSGVYFVSIQTDKDVFKSEIIKN